MKLIPLMAAMLCITAAGFAQTKHITFIKKDGRATTNRDSAFMVRTIVDPEAGSNLYAFTEAGVDGKLMREGKTLKAEYILPDGEMSEYYPNGQRLSYTVYDHARAQKETYYYPNGVVYLVRENTFSTPNPAVPQRYDTHTRIVTCNDSTGKVLATDGNGRYITFHTRRADRADYIDAVYAAPEALDEYLYEEGPLKDGKKDGEWKGRSADGRIHYIEHFKDGEFVDGASALSGEMAHRYNKQVYMAEFKGGLNMFYQFLGNNIRYPSEDRVRNVQGKVFATFIVEKDGSLSDMKILRGISEGTSAETLRVLQLSSPWKPSYMHGIPLRTQYTVPVSFTLSSK